MSKYAKRQIEKQQPDNRNRGGSVDIFEEDVDSDEFAIDSEESEEEIKKIHKKSFGKIKLDQPSESVGWGKRITKIYSFLSFSIRPDVLSKQCTAHMNTSS